MVGSTQRMHKLLYQLGLRDNVDLVISAFNAIAAETRHLPPGIERQHWDADALREKDLEIAEKEAWARGVGLESCLNLVARFGPGKRAT